MPTMDKQGCGALVRVEEPAGRHAHTRFAHCGDKIFEGVVLCEVCDPPAEKPEGGV